MSKESSYAEGAAHNTVLRDGVHVNAVHECQRLEARATRHRKEMTHLLDRNVALRAYLQKLRANTDDHDLIDEINLLLDPTREGK